MFIKTMATIIVLLAVFSWLLFSAPRSHDAMFIMEEEITLYTYKSGHVVSQQVFPPYSDMHKKLNQWLSDYSNSWKHTLVNYAPRFYFKSESISLNFMPGVAVINFSEWSDTARTSIIKEINAPDFIMDSDD